MTETAGAPEGYTEINPIETQGSTWRVFVHKGGYFLARCGDLENSAPSYPELDAKCRTSSSLHRVKVDIPYARWSGNDIIDGTATGLHGSNGNVLTREDVNGKAGTGQVTYSGRDYMQRPSDQDRAAMEDLARHIEAGRRALRSLEAKYSFGSGGIQGVVTRAVQAAREARDADA